MPTILTGNDKLNEKTSAKRMMCRFTSKVYEPFEKDDIPMFRSVVLITLTHFSSGKCPLIIVKFI